MGSSKFVCEDRHDTWKEPCHDPDGWMVGAALAEFTHGTRAAVSRRVANIASFLVGLVLSLRMVQESRGVLARRSAGRLNRGKGQSFSSSPTGLADGFGLEKEPYDKSRFTPGLYVGPRLRAVCPD
jgi:hypothetical protein